MMLDRSPEIATATAQASAKRAPTPGERPAFSYAMAAARLESDAGRSLEAFGATPQKTLTVPPPSATKTALANRSAEQQSGSSQNPAAPRVHDIAHARHAPPNQPSVRESLTGPSSLTRLHGAGVAAPPMPQMAPLAAVEAAVARAQPQSVAGAADAGKSEAAKQTAKLRPQNAPHAPKPMQDDFARLLASRLESGASQFDLRLDPPELGRVEARLTLGDDGKAALSLTFDNQAAFDLFARDESALRTALMQSGFDLGGGALAFSLGIRSDAPPAPHASPAADGRIGCATVTGSSIIDLRV
jgi:flagellar hook-length control protein FliK